MKTAPRRGNGSFWKIAPGKSVTVAWKTHEGKGYESWSAPQLVAGFRQTRTEVLELLCDLTPDLWSRWGSRPGRITSVLDLGRWVANHDVGHIAQIRRQCQAG